MVAVNCAKNSCLSRNSCFLWTKEGWIVQNMESHQETLQDTWEHNKNTPGCIFPCFFSARKTPVMHFVHLCTPHDIIGVKIMPPSDRAHPQLHCVKCWSKSDRQFPRYWHFCILPPFFPIWPLSDHPASETWLQIRLHNNWSPSLPRPLQMPLLVHWQLGWHPSACQSMTGTP